MGSPHFDIPLNLPHAGKVALRIHDIVRLRSDHEDGKYDELCAVCMRLVVLLDPYLRSGENPCAEDANSIVREAAELGRLIVDGIEENGLGLDRLGQAVRNFFECIELGVEGAEEAFDCLVEFCQAEEGVLSKACQYPTLNQQNAGFNFCFVSWLSHSSW